MIADHFPLPIREKMLALHNPERESLGTRVYAVGSMESPRTPGQRAAQLRVDVQDVDCSSAVIRLRDGKGRREKARLHELPLTPAAMAVLEPVLDRPRETARVFTNDGKRQCTVDTLSKAVRDISARLVKEAKVGSQSSYANMRATCESLLASLQIGKNFRAHLQSHGLGGVQDRHYDKYDYLHEKRVALESWAAFLQSLTQPVPQNVVPIRKSA